MERFKKFLKENWYLIAALLYLIMPFDFLPDDIPLIGSVDDALFLLVEVVRRYREHAD
jgi:uncharacterized membrane protein YkvA (DUF1232 family)